MAFSEGQPSHVKVSAELHSHPLLNVQASFDFLSVNHKYSVRENDSSNRFHLRNNHDDSCLDRTNAMDVFAFTEAYTPTFTFEPMFQPIAGLQNAPEELEPSMSFGNNSWDSLDSLLSPNQREYV